MNNEYCDCNDCQESDKPCSFDCAYNEECEACLEARETKEEIEFEIDNARGFYA